MVLVLSLACAGALVPQGGARAGFGSLYTDLVCREITEIPGEFDFATSFVGLAKCERLCLDAAAVCKRAVRDAATCQLAFANDFVAFDSRLECAGLTGPLLRDCKAGWAFDKQVWRQFIRDQRSGALGLCLTEGLICANACSG